MPVPKGYDDPREVREARQRPPETYPTVTEWWADYHGFVPIQMAHGLSQLTKTGMSFHDAYLRLLGAGKIIELEPLRPDSPHWAERDARLATATEAADAPETTDDDETRHA
ncbi:MAG: hypothetical protein KF809_18905 [Chloroflexi bacterium]|nr:hypothetical protein [Chloroflexota bacterium]